MPRITSPDNPRLKQVMRLLASSRERRKVRRCVLEGVHLVDAYLDRYGPPETVVVLEVGVEDPRMRRLRDRMPPTHVLSISPSLWADLIQLPIETAVIAIVPAPVPTATRAADFCLLLEDVQDPGNVGSIVRTAAAAGVAQIHMSSGCAFAWSPKVLRAGQGGHFHLDIFEDVDLAAWMRAYQGTTIATVARGGVSLFAAALRAPIAIAIGNEGTGLSDAVRDTAAHCVTIPMPGRFESLNAAAATAVCLFECVRQQQATRR